MFWKGLFTNFLGEITLLCANNNINLALFLNCLHSALLLDFPSVSAKPEQTRRSHVRKNTEVTLKMAMERSNASKADGGPDQ